MEVIAQGNCNQRKHTQGIQSRYNDNHFVDDFYPNRNTDITLRIRVAISPMKRVPIQIDGGLNLISKVPVFECDRIRVVILIVFLIAMCVLKCEIVLKFSLFALERHVQGCDKTQENIHQGRETQGTTKYLSHHRTLSISCAERTNQTGYTVLKELTEQ